MDGREVGIVEIGPDQLEPDGGAGLDLFGDLIDRRSRMHVVGRLDHVERQTRAEEQPGRDQQDQRLEDVVLGKEVALRRGREDEHRDRCDDERLNPGEDVDELGHRFAVDEHHLHQEQLGVEDEQERQQGGADVVAEALETGLDRIAAGDARRGVGGEAHGWRVVGQDAEVEHEEVRRDRRDDEPFGRRQRDDHRRHQRGHHDVVRRRRQSHAEDEAHDGHEDQHQHQRAAGQLLDQRADDLVRAGQRDGADDDAGRTGGDRDGDHVARAADHAVEELLHQPWLSAAPTFAPTAQQRLDRVLRERDEDHRGRRPEGREARRQALHHHEVEEDDDRQDEVQARQRDLRRRAASRAAARPGRRP